MLVDAILIECASGQRQNLESVDLAYDPAEQIVVVRTGVERIEIRNARLQVFSDRDRRDAMQAEGFMRRQNTSCYEPVLLKISPLSDIQ